MTTASPLPSMIRVVPVVTTIVAVRTMVPLQEKVTVPPPAMAASRLASSQVETMLVAGGKVRDRFWLASAL